MYRRSQESRLERRAELEAVVCLVAAISPHPLRQGVAYHLWKTAMQILGHSRVVTTMKDGKPTEDDLRATFEAAHWIW